MTTVFCTVDLRKKYLLKSDHHHFLEYNFQHAYTFPQIYITKFAAPNSKHLLDNFVSIPSRVLVLVAFSSHARILGESFPSCAFFFFFFKSGDQFARTNSSLEARDESTVSQQAETTVDKRSLSRGVCAAVSPLLLRWVKSICVFRYNPPPSLFCRI